jgi:uncharacterized protein YacL (UPF0231 family)
VPPLGQQSEVALYAFDVFFRSLIGHVNMFISEPHDRYLHWIIENIKYTRARIDTRFQAVKDHSVLVFVY